MSEFIISGLWRASWQGAVLFFVVAVFVKLTPRISPAIHCWAWRLVCLKMLVAFFVASAIELPLLSAESPQLLRANTAAPFPLSTDETVDVGVSAAEPGASLLQLPILEDRLTIPLELILATLWMLGVGYQFYRLVTDWRLVKRRLAEATEEQAEAPVKLLRSEVIESQMATCPRLLSASSTNCPAIIGTLSPQLLIPQSVLDESDEEDLRMLIRHELAHIRRGDLWWNWLAAACQLLFYFHPAVWWTLKEWRMSQESACDELALGGRSDESADYASMLLEIALSKDPSRSLSYAIGVFDSFETLKKRIENMAYFGSHSKLRIGLAYSFVALMTLGLLPWQVVSQNPVGVEIAAADEVDNSATRKKFDGVWVSVDDVADVSDLNHKFGRDFSRLMKKMTPDIKTTKSAKKTTSGFGSASGSGFGGGAAGGAGGGTVFEGSPMLAVALKVETDGPCELMLLDELVGVDAAGRKYKSLPTSSTSFMLCPEYEKQQAGQPGITIAYFPKSVRKVEQFAQLRGTVEISMVESDSVEFQRLRVGATQKTNLGEYRITLLEAGRDGTKIAVQYPLPKTLRDAMGSRPGDAAGFERRVNAQRMLPGMIRPEFIGSDGLTYQPNSTGSHGSGQQTSTFSSTSGPNGQKFSGSGGFSSRTAGAVEYIYGFEQLPPGVKIVGLRARILEVPTDVKVVPFELTNVQLK